MIARLREVAARYEPPDFAEATSADATLFLCAIDHRTGYRGAHRVGEAGPFEGSDLLWQLGWAAERARPGALSASSLRAVSAADVEELFRAGEETIAGADVRARLWRNLASGLERRYGGEAETVLASAAGRLKGEGGLIPRLAAFEAFSDPLEKKSFLFAKIAARRGWFRPVDPESWEVCADNVLMRLALRAGLVAPSGDPGAVRAATREAFRRVAQEAGIEPPVLDDLLWQLGREDPDLLGTAGGAELREPPRPEGTVWY
ncbi:MAG TPA: hypothetical protein VKA89_09430 [Solirubrobacterales bacterium]|nr:hypothetical protein [Solirubrobacterales bacterium]